MRNINTVHKVVATMANQLHKLGYSLSQAFKTAWKRVKNFLAFTLMSCFNISSRFTLFQTEQVRHGASA